MRYIKAIYETYASYDIRDIEDELNIKWDDVEDWWIEWEILHMVMKNGSHHEYREEVDYTDLERPISVKTFCSNYKEIDP